MIFHRKINAILLNIVQQCAFSYQCLESYPKARMEATLYLVRTLNNLYSRCIANQTIFVAMRNISNEVCKQWCALTTKEGQETKGKLLIEFNLITSDGVRNIAQ
jgi:hypothetical protein